MRLTTVLEHPESVAAREVAHAGHVHGLSVDVHGDDADGAWRDFQRRVGDVHAVPRIDVDEDGRRLREADGLDGGKRGVRRDEDLVAGLHAERPERHPQRGGPGAREHGVTHADVAGEVGLEAPALRTEDPLARVHGGDDRLLELVVHGWPGERNPPETHQVRLLRGGCTARGSTAGVRRARFRRPPRARSGSCDRPRCAG